MICKGNNRKPFRINTYAEAISRLMLKKMIFFNI